MFNDLVVANKSITEMEVGSTEMIDDIALNVLMQDCPDFALPVRKFEIDNIVKLRYELVSGIRLSYCPAQMKKMEFIKLLSGLLNPFKLCMDWFLDYHNLYLDKNYIFTSRDFSSVKYIYIPVGSHANSEAEIKAFFSDVILWAELVDDPGYTMNLLRLIRNPNSNLLSLLEYIKQGQQNETHKHNSLSEKEQRPKESISLSQMERKLEAQAEKKNAVIEQFVKGKKESIPVPERKIVEPKVVESIKEDEQFGMDSAMNNILAGLGSELEEKKEKKKKKEKNVREKSVKNKSVKEKKQGGLLSGFLGGGKKEDFVNVIDPLKKSINAPKSNSNSVPNNSYAQKNMKEVATELPNAEHFSNMIQNNGGMDDCTVIEEGHMDDPNNLFLSLTEGAIGYECPQLIKLNLAEGFVTLGRRDKNGMAQTTYGFDSSLSFISRMHFRIEKTSDGYSIIDTDSKGGTFLNGQRLMANIAYPMNVGDVITITSRHLSYRVSQ